MSSQAPKPEFIGYCAKPLSARPAWLNRTTVEAIASVSECMSHRPEGWVDRWNFNESGYYRDAETALALYSDQSHAGVALLAYRLYPTFVDGWGDGEPRLRELAIQTLTGDSVVLPDPCERSDFEFLGFDVSCGSAACDNADGKQRMLPMFNCSPLSCNHEAERMTVNRWCLLDRYEDAMNVAHTFAREGEVEPGPYFIVEVWRHIRGERAIKEGRFACSPPHPLPPPLP